MKKYLLKTLIFSALACVILILSFVAIAISPKFVHRTNIKSTKGGYGASLLRYREAKSFSEVDLVFLGSSHC